MTKNTFRTLAVFVLLTLGACAQVPKESVELSATVGRDLAIAQKSHKATAELLFSRMKADINAFIDDVYAPYVIGESIAKQKKEDKKGTENTIFGALRVMGDDASPADEKRVGLLILQSYVTKVQKRIDKRRTTMLAKIEEQERSVMSAIDRTYNQLHYANSIVTGHLASVVEVHDAQDVILNEFGLEGLRAEVGEKVAKMSEGVAKIVDEGRKAELTVKKVVDDATASDATMTDLNKRLDSVLGIPPPPPKAKASNN